MWDGTWLPSGPPPHEDSNPRAAQPCLLSAGTWKNRPYFSTRKETHLCKSVAATPFLVQVVVQQPLANVLCHLDEPDVPAQRGRMGTAWKYTPEQPPRSGGSNLAHFHAPEEGLSLFCFYLRLCVLDSSALPIQEAILSVDDLLGLAGLFKGRFQLQCHVFAHCRRESIAGQ